MTLFPSDLRPLPRRAKTALVFAGLWLTSIGIALSGGAFRSEFGRYQDEGMHYVTGLFAQDFLTSGHWLQPVRFAQQYYLHYPKIALGQWPPGFSLMQAAWGMLFGVSRISMMFGMTVLTAWLGWLIYSNGARYFGLLWGLLAALLAIAAPLTQEQTAMVMAEIPLAAASFLAICAFARFLDSSRMRDALGFAVWTFAAIMIKGNGWAVVLAAPAILLLTGHLRLLWNRRLWIAALVTALLCVPYTLITMRIVSQGWDTRSFPGFRYELSSLGIHLGFAAHLLGIPLAILAAIGAFASFTKRGDTFWRSITIYGAAIIVFHVAIPSSIEPRKIYQLVPVVCLLMLAGLNWLASLLPMTAIARPALAVLTAVVFLFPGFSLLPPYRPGFAPAVEALIGRPGGRGTAILISSNPQYSDSEAAIIAEWASRARNDGTYLIRGTKLLSRNIPAQPDGAEFAASFTTPRAILDALSSIPIAFVFLDTTAARISYPHHALLKAALESDPAEWEHIYSSRQNGHEIEIYRFHTDLSGVPVHYSVDLTRKIGTEITTGP